MSIVQNKFSETNKYQESYTQDGTILEKEIIDNKYERAPYEPTDEEKDIRAMILRHFTLGMTNMWTPRVEFNDLPVIERMQVDQMSFNAYQSNNGNSASQDDIQGWRSNAMRPIVRNKCVSIAAHATARLIFPKVFAYNDEVDEQHDAAQVMMDLMEWSADQSDYSKTALYRTITALTDPASIGYTEYCEVFRQVKEEKKNGKWKYKTVLDENLSGFQDSVIPVDQLYIENFFEADIQKQGFLIMRKVMSWDLALAKYGEKYPNFNKYVKPGVQMLYSDANQSFYWVYDPIMRGQDVEEITYWNKSLDVKLIMVNGVLLTDCDNPNPRNDKLYPFDKFGYEIINNRCFYYKSLAFKMQQDANIINTLYPMIIDGTYLNIMPPLVNVGQDMIGSDVIVPGAVTTLSIGSALTPIKAANDIRTGIETLMKVEESINESSQSTVEQGQQAPGSQTAYEISRLEQNSATVLGLFIKMIAQHVKDFGKLRLGDILQYLTIADVSKIEGDKLTFKAFLLHDKQSAGTTKTRKIKFDVNMPDEPQTDAEKLDTSYGVMDEEGGPESKLEIYRANPTLFRELKYMIAVSPDVLNPRSEDLERAFGLELYDRAIMNPMADQEQIYRLLLQTDPKTKKDPDKYVMKQQMVDPMQQAMNGQAIQAQQGPQGAQSVKQGTVPQAKATSPLASIMNKPSQTPTVGL